MARARRATAGLCAVTICLMVMQAPAWGDTRTVYLEPFPDIEQTPREMYWKDITGASYPEEFIDNFSYANATAILTYSTFDWLHFTGTLYATGLKPNFCYQTKLCGKPEVYYGAAGDDAANEKIGYVGRWWREEPNPANADDAEYEANKDNPAYVYKGYFLFDFFATDDSGSATVNFTSDSSYHAI